MTVEELVNFLSQYPRGYQVYMQVEGTLWSFPTPKLVQAGENTDKYMDMGFNYLVVDSEKLTDWQGYV